MRWRGQNSRVLLFLAAGLACAQSTGTRYLEITLPVDVRSEKVFAVCALEGQKFASWVQPRPGVSSYLIGTVFEGRPATRIRALMYAPGCALQALDLPLTDSAHQRCAFTCRPLGSISITGALAHPERLYGREVELQVKYLARWAQTFLGLDAGMVPAIPIGGEAVVSADGRFRFSVPDFSRDPLAASPDHPGELQVWARDNVTLRPAAQLIPADPRVNRTRMGGLAIERAYPPEIVFSPCISSSAPTHDAEGFALRPAPSDACDR